MSTARAARLRAISDALGDRQLVWFGIRGADAESLLAIPQFTASFAVTAPLEAGKLEADVTLEAIKGRRVDLDAYDIDLDDGAEVEELRQLVSRALSRRSAVSTYRPSTFLSEIAFTTKATTRPLGLFKDHQLAFEHKPWTETELHAAGIRTIPWEYVATERRGRIPIGEGMPPVVLRPNRSSGGVGIAVARTREQLNAAWTAGPGHLMGIAPFLEEAIPLNVNACVYGPHQVTVHPASVQLIGLEGWTTRRFGYCGNDFAAMADVAPAAMAELDALTRTIGGWLGAMGYRGAFGADFLLDGGDLYFAEVNARLQGSSRMAASLAARTGHTDLLLDHVAAFLGLEPDESLTVGDWVAELPAAAQVIKHHLGSEAKVARPLAGDRLPPAMHTSLVPSPGTWIDPGAVTWCLEVDGRVTRTGLELTDPRVIELASWLDPPSGIDQPPTDTA